MPEADLNSGSAVHKPNMLITMLRWYSNCSTKVQTFKLPSYDEVS